MKNSKLETITNLFQGNEIRSVWDADREDYYFSVVDVISVLTNSSNHRYYWVVLKSRLKENLNVAKRGGTVSKFAKERYERETKSSVITRENAIAKRHNNPKIVSKK